MDKVYMDYFSQIDSTLNKYYGQYLAPYYQREVKNLREKQTKELNKLASNNSYQALTPTATSMYNLNASIASGEWTSKHLEYCVDQANKSIEKNGKIQQDLKEVTDTLRGVLYHKLGGGNMEKGKKIYDNLSKKYGGDLALIYVSKKMEENFVKMMAKEIPQESSLSKIIGNGLRESFIGMVVTSQRSESELERKINEKNTKLSNGEEIAAGAVSVATDLLTLRLPGSAITARGIKVATSLEAAGRTLNHVISDSEFNQFSKDVFGSENAINEIQKAGRKTNKGELMTSFNDGFKNKLKITEERSPDKKYLKSDEKALLDYIKNEQKSGMTMLQIVRDSGIGYKKINCPSWMLKKTPEECEKYARNFLAIAAQMQAKGIEKTTIGAKAMTIREISSRAWEYAVAAHSMRAKENLQQQTQQEKKSEKGESKVNQNDLQKIYGQQSQNVTQSVTQQPSQQQTQQANADNTSGWNNLLSTLGLSGFGDVGRNFGHVSAMLPDMLINMFTGKSKVKLEDNLLPTAAIVLSFFVKNKFLKFLLMGLGGANLLNKLAHENLENEGIIKSGSKQYVTHKEESQDPRIKNVEIKGNTMLVNIDNAPYVVTLDDYSIDAYNKGVLPKSTLANAVLRQFDEQAVVQGGSATYERTMAQSEDRRQNVGIK